MKHLLKFLLGALVVALTLMSVTTLQAQKTTITKKALQDIAKKEQPAELNVAIMVSKYKLGTYNLKAMVVAENDFTKHAFYEVQWFRNNKPISKAWKLTGVKAGFYQVLVIQNFGSHRWGKASVNLGEPHTLDHFDSDDM